VTEERVFTDCFAQKMHGTDQANSCYYYSCKALPSSWKFSIWDLYRSRLIQSLLLQPISVQITLSTVPLFTPLFEW